MADSRKKRGIGKYENLNILNKKNFLGEIKIKGLHLVKKRKIVDTGFKMDYDVAELQLYLIAHNKAVSRRFLIPNTLRE